MRKTVCIILAALICAIAAGCGPSSGSRPAQGNGVKTVSDVLNEKMNGSGQTEDSSTSQSPDAFSSRPVQSGQTPVDVDLTKLSSTMVYSEVYNMMVSPDDYLGKKVRMRGPFSFAEGNGRYYFACVISDATACCAQGIEFVLKDERSFPDEYPARGTEITVTGIFDTYMEGTNLYCQLIDASLE